MRLALVVATLLCLAGLAVAVVGPLTGPRTQTCGPGMDLASCEAAVDAVLRRGMPGIHPLILRAHVEPGPAAAAAQLGHRATVTFDLLGVPSDTSIDLYYDAGGHWGGVASRGVAELAAWTLLPVVLAMAVAITLIVIARRGGARRPADHV